MPIDRYPREAEGKGRPENQAPKGSVISRESPRVAIPVIVFEILGILEDELDAGPSPSRIRLRDLRAKLLRAYPYLRVTESDVAQALAEMDGEPHDGF